MKQDDAIIILTPGFPKNEHDINCIPALQNYVRSLKEKLIGTEVIVISFEYPFVSRQYLWHEIPVFSIGGANKKGISKFITWRKVTRLLTRLELIYEFHCIHAFWLTECTALMNRFIKKKNLHGIATIMGTDTFLSNRYLKILKLKSSNFKITAGSQNAADQLFKSVGVEVNHIIPIGLTPADIKGSVTNPEYRFDIIGVGSLIPIKQFDLFIKVISRIKTRVEGLKAAIIGGGPEMEALKKMITDYSVEGQVTLLGELPRDDVLRIMGESKVLLHTSAYEGQGYVFLEALSKGMSIASFDVGFRPDSHKVHTYHKLEVMADELPGIINSFKYYGPVEVPAINDTVMSYKKLYTDE